MRPDSSFPGDHVTLLSADSFTFLYGGKRGIGLLALIVDIAVAWARIFVGVHWPFDMIGAAIVAWLACMVGSPCCRSQFPGADEIRGSRPHRLHWKR
jgi:undecaprenyl-diphosphatase